MKNAIALLLFLVLSVPAFALDPMPFTDRAEEERFQQITRELRCLVCQNQNIADSNAELARDLRNETFAMMRAGKTDDEIKQFMTERYGDFVLYRPPMKRSTWLLWFGPFVVLLVGAFVVYRLIRRKPAARDDQSPVDPVVAPGAARDPNEMIP